MLPVGATGYIAKVLHTEVADDLSSFHPKASSKFKVDFDLIGDETKSTNELVKALLRLIEQLHHD